MILQNYQNVTEMTSNMIYIVAFGVGLKSHSGGGVKIDLIFWPKLNICCIHSKEITVFCEYIFPGPLKT